MSAEARGHAPHAPGIDASGLPPLTSPCPALACCLWLASSPGLLVPGSAGQTVTLLVPAFAGMPPEARRADSARADLTSGLKARPRPGAMIRQMRQADAPGRDSSDPKRWLSAPLPALSWSADPALRNPRPAAGSSLLPALPILPLWSSCRPCPSCRVRRRCRKHASDDPLHASLCLVPWHAGPNGAGGGTPPRQRRQGLDKAGQGVPRRAQDKVLTRRTQASGEALACCRQKGRQAARRDARQARLGTCGQDPPSSRHPGHVRRRLLRQHARLSAGNDPCQDAAQGQSFSAAPASAWSPFSSPAWPAGRTTAP